MRGVTLDTGALIGSSAGIEPPPSSPEAMTLMEQKPAITVLDVVALLADLAEHRLVRGQVGTVVERLGDDVFEVEFSDDDGRMYAELAVEGQLLLVLHHRPVKAT